MKWKLILPLAAVACAAILWPRGTAPAAKITLPHTLVRQSPVTITTTVSPDVSAPGGFDRARIMADLAIIGDPSVAALVEQIFSARTPLEAGKAADSLAALGTHEAIACLLGSASLQDNQECRTAILEGLQNLTRMEGMDTLVSVLTATRDPQFLAAAVETLARVAQPETLAALVDYYRERNEGPDQKNAVLEAIAALRNPSVSRALGKLAGQPEPGLAAAATQALNGMDQLSISGNSP